MNPLLILGGLAVGAYVLMSSKGGGAGGSVASAQQAATQATNQTAGDSTSGTPDPNATYLGEVTNGTVSGFYDPMSGRTY